MADINNIVITGRLTKDAVFKTLPTGTNVLEFDVANNTGFGQYAKTNYFKVNLWGKSAQSLTQYMVKGKFVAVTGEVSVDKWRAQDGTDKTVIKISTTSVQLMNDGGKKDSDLGYNVVNDKEEDTF